MRVALLTTYRVNKREPVAVLLERIHSAFLVSGLGEPAVQFSFSDALLPGLFVSSVDRVLKRHPDLARFVSADPVHPGGHPLRQISNGPGSPAEGEAVEFSRLLAIATGVPRSFPFHNFSLHFRSPAFGTIPPHRGIAEGMSSGVIVSDSWWVNGRQRELFAMSSVDAAPSGKKLPAPSGPLATVLAACGKAASTAQVPLLEDATASVPPTPRPCPEVVAAIDALVRNYRASLGEAIDRAALPHDLPSADAALRMTSVGLTSGPKKPMLVRAFGPLGYDCRGGSGTFALRRRTAGNLTVGVCLDVGTWSNNLSAGFLVQGLGFAARIPLPVSKRAMGSGQYPIGDAARWQQIVENLAALVAEYERGIVLEIEAAAGPTPEWYRPES